MLLECKPIPVGPSPITPGWFGFGTGPKGQIRGFGFLESSTWVGAVSAYIQWRLTGRV